MPIRALCLLALILVGDGKAVGSEASEHQRIARSIRQRFESSLFQLPPEVQAHWGLRLYRTTGDSIYHYAILNHALLLERNFLRDVAGWRDTEYRQLRNRQLLDQFDGKSRKNRLRRAMFERRPGMQYLLALLSAHNRLAELGRDEGELAAAMSVSREILESADLRSFLLDEDVIRIYGAQAVNYVYFLKAIGIADLRADYLQAFQRTFPDKDDDELSDLEFKDKVYGLTHFILADSRYFQRTVDSGEHRWILDYFDAQIDRILAKTKADVIAEVGLCFLLTGREDAVALVRCRDAVARQFDEEARMIPSVSGRIDLETGEHRNVLAAILLGWQGGLSPGPDLSAWMPMRKLLAP